MRLWKIELQKLADEIGLRIAVCHFPPGTSKWNKIEHRLFSGLKEQRLPSDEVDEISGSSAGSIQSARGGRRHVVPQTGCVSQELVDRK